MSTLNEQHTVHSHPAPACHHVHVLARQGRSPKRHISSCESGSIPQGTMCLGQYRAIPGGRGKRACDKVHYPLFFYHFYFFKPPLTLTYLTYRSKLFAFDVFRFLLKIAEELISLKVRLTCRFKTIETIDRI